MATKITREILECYLYCKTKARLKLAGEQGNKSDYEVLLGANREEVRQQAIGKILAKHPEEHVPRDIILTTDELRTGPTYVLDAILEDDLVSLHFDGLKKVDGPSKLGDFHYVPILFQEGRKVGKVQRLLLELSGLVLSRLQGQMPSSGIIWHGTECRTTRLRLNADLRRTERLLREVKDMVDAESPPKLNLNNHCQVCEFQGRCHDQAVQEDNITLLRGMGEKELRRLDRKGIFTIAQLSCIFRLRKRGKRVKRQHHPHYFALQAAAIRDKKIYVLKPPPLPSSPVRIYLDIEGNPERGFAYLLGMIVDQGGDMAQFSFWADKEDEEQIIFRRMLAIVSLHNNYALIHYGSYETSFLKRMKKAFGRNPVFTRMLSRTVNLLSVIHTHIYFPLHSNGLKSIGKYLGCTWTDQDASGLKSIVLRSRWEKEHDETLKRQLERYNLEDCLALKRIAELVYTISEGFNKESSVPEIVLGGCIVAGAENVNAVSTSREIPRSSFALPDLQFVNQCAYFDYQREKVFLRTSTAIRKAKSMREKQGRHSKLRINKTIEVRSRKCPSCGCTSLVRHYNKTRTKLAYDLRVSESGIKRQVILCKAALHYCPECQGYFLPPRYRRAAKHWHSLISWTMYQQGAIAPVPAIMRPLRSSSSL